MVRSVDLIIQVILNSFDWMKLHFNIHVATKHSLLLLLILLSLFLSMRKSSKYGKIDIHISNMTQYII